jgi:pimeloyl-ACP methyl ester carboxylesterase
VGGFTRILIAVCAGALPAAAPADVGVPPSRTAPPGEFVEVGSHRLHLHCRGTGSPTVVFDSGLGGSSLDWSRVHPRVALLTRACVYDRAGYGWSDPGPNPRDSVRIVAELAELLQRGRVAPPYVLVGHSFGGFNVRLFASEHPDATAALVLIDSSHERQFDEFDDAGLPSVAPRSGQIIIGNPNAVPAALPPELLPLALSFTRRPGFVAALRSELGNLRRSANELRDARIPDVPLIVISHRIDEDSPSVRRDRLWFGMQQELAKRTSEGRLVVANTGDHYVQLSDPDVVVSAIHEVLDRTRPGRTASTRPPTGG